MDKVDMPVLLMPAGNDPENLKEGAVFFFESWWRFHIFMEI